MSTFVDVIEISVSVVQLILKEFILLQNEKNRLTSAAVSMLNSAQQEIFCFVLFYNDYNQPLERLGL